MEHFGTVIMIGMPYGAVRAWIPVPRDPTASTPKHPQQPLPPTVQEGILKLAEMGPTGRSGGGGGLGGANGGAGDMVPLSLAPTPTPSQAVRRADQAISFSWFACWVKIASVGNPNRTLDGLRSVGLCGFNPSVSRAWVGSGRDGQKVKIVPAEVGGGRHEAGSAHMPTPPCPMPCHPCRPCHPT